MRKKTIGWAGVALGAFAFVAAGAVWQRWVLEGDDDRGLDSEAPISQAGTSPDDPPCPAPFEMLPSGTCFYLPDDATPSTRLAIYLHGMTTSTSFARAEGKRLVEAAEGKLAVLAPLGRRGVCNWTDEVRRHHCWPSHPKNEAALAALVEGLRADLAELDHRFPGRPPPVLVGFSNGGYAAVLLASSGALELDGLAVLNAGASAQVEDAPTLPTLLRAAKADPWHHETMVEFKDRLEQAGWAPTWQERDGAHAAEASDFAAAARFILGLDETPL